MENAFDCDNCGSKNIGETYQDKTGNTFVCQDCFDKSNDGTYFVPAVRVKKEDDIKEGLAYVRQELLNKNLSVPVGDVIMYHDEKPLPYRWINETEVFQILYEGEWHKGVSTDWDFDEDGKNSRLKIADRGECISDEELQEEIKLSKAQDGNSLRDNIKDLLSEEISDLIGDKFADAETVCSFADTIFDVLGINPHEQDLVNAKIVINPKVRITVKGGVAIPDEVTAGIDFSIDDQD